MAITVGEFQFKTLCNGNVEVSTRGKDGEYDHSQEIHRETLLTALGIESGFKQVFPIPVDTEGELPYNTSK